MMDELDFDTEADPEFGALLPSPDRQREIAEGDNLPVEANLPSSSQVTPFEISSPQNYSSWAERPLQQDHFGDGSSRISSSRSHSASPFRIPLHLTKKSFATHASYFERPNRYLGPASTWRSWTEQDRAVATAVDREKAMNLSRHLYNSYALRKHATFSDLESEYLDDRDRGRKRSRKGKSPENNAIEKILESDNTQNIIPFKPPRAWTAWPLPPAEVPREALIPDVFAGRVCRSRDSRSSALLEESLLAATTKLARQRWNLRESEKFIDPKSPSPVLQPMGHKDPPELKTEVPAISDVQGETNSDDSMDTDSNVLDHPVEQQSDGTSSSSPSEAQPSPAKPAVFSSQMYASSLASTTSTQDHSKDEEPEFTIDDDKVRELIMPSVRHIISRLDDVLMAAHRSRQPYAYGTNRSDSRSTSKSAVDEIQTTDRDDTKARVNSGSRSPRKSNSAVDNSESRTRSHSQVQTRSEPLNPHDWSSIIGLASIVQAFDSTTIAKASERCAKLLGENMFLRTFHEAESSHGSTKYNHTVLTGSPHEMISGPWFEEDFIIDDEASDGEVDVEPNDESAMDDSTGAMLRRTSRACDQCKRLRSRCRPSLLPVGHKSKVALVPCARCEQSQQLCSMIEIAVVLPPVAEGVDRYCPFPNCERYSIPFRKRGNLKRHITARHGEEQTPLPFSREVSRKRSFSSMRDSGSPVIEGIPYFCPISACPRSINGPRGPYTIGSRLYNHLRQVHPEVDVDIVKQLELQRRGERRGRWSDKRRYRSRSQTRKSQDRADVEPQEEDSEG